MYNDFQIFCVGVAAVLDTVLLLTLMERRNWRYALLPLILLALSAWLMHAAAFVHMLLSQRANAGQSIHQAAMTLFIFGILLMPSAMLHSAWRVYRTGLATAGHVYWPYLLTYLPLLGLIPVIRELDADVARTPLSLLAPWTTTYALGVMAINLFSAATFLRLRHRIEPLWARRFFSCLAVYLAVKAAVLPVTIWGVLPRWPELESWLFVINMAGPAILVLLFAYFVIRFHFMSLMLERTAVYGAIIVGAMLFHRLLIERWTENLTDRFRVDFGIIEGVAALALILLYQPFRQRTAEALRYLMGSRVAEVRQRIRQVAIQMSGHAGQPIPEVLTWFNHAVRDALQVQFIAGWLIDSKEKVTTRCGEYHRLPDEQVSVLHDLLKTTGVTHCSWRDAPHQMALDCLQMADASLAVALFHQNIRGLLLFGRLPRGRDFGEEETNDAILLAEQLAISLNNSLLQ